MANDKVAIWGNQLVFGRKTANGELLIGNGDGFTLSTLTAGSGITITNAAGAITVASSGLGVIDVANGGTGQSSLTADNVILGNGTGAVKFVAPGTSGNLLTSDGTTWNSTAPTWNNLVKTSDQSLTSSTTWTSVTGLTFSIAANKTYTIEFFLNIDSGAGGVLTGVYADVTATSLKVAYDINSTVLAYDTNVVGFTGSANVLFVLRAVIVNGANAGTFAPRFTQYASNAAATTIQKGSWLRWAEAG